VTAAAAWIPFTSDRSLNLTSRRSQSFAVNPLYGFLLDQASVR
jgi:hypothetical protein